MAATSSVFLMYHELLVPGRPLNVAEPGYARYAVSAGDFRAQLDRLRAGGIAGMSVGTALARAGGARVAITFDDGCATDLAVAAPLLLAAGCGATFFVTAGFVGRRGYLAPNGVRELHDLGLEVGCHSMSHAYLPDLSDAALHVELVEARDRLEQWIGARVAHFSCPGGRWSQRVADTARAAGYESVATSEIGANRVDADRYRLARVAVMHGLTIAEFDRVVRARGLLTRRARGAVLGAAKRIFGNSGYERLRARVLGRS